MTDRPPHPHITVNNGGGCTPQQAAAAIAAVERFLRDHARSPETAHQATASGWIRAAREEAVERSVERAGARGFPLF